MYLEYFIRNTKFDKHVSKTVPESIKKSKSELKPRSLYYQPIEYTLSVCFLNEKRVGLAR